MGSTILSLIDAVEHGEKASAERLFAALYAELHRVARRELARRGANLSISATTLLHEAYLNMAGRDGSLFPDRARFMAYAGRVMRGLIIDHARNRQAQKRGGHFEITYIGDQTHDEVVDTSELTQISDALDELAKVEPSLVEVVDLKFFCGFSFAEIAAMQNISERTV
ncbi:MAG: ECF-type sigma factor, partial [Bryobacteraceae bacterium]